jgi:hypothetical protein
VQELDETKAFLDVFERCKEGGPVPHNFPSAGESRELCRTLSHVPDIVFDRSTLAGFKALRSLVFKIPEECVEWEDDYWFHEWMDLEGAIRLMPPCCTSLTVERSLMGGRLLVFPPIKQLAKPTGEQLPEVKDEGRITHYFKHIKRRSAPQERVFQLNVTTKGSTNVSTYRLVTNHQ